MKSMRVLHVIPSLQKAAGTSVFCVEVCDSLMDVGVDCCIAVRRKLSTDYKSQKGVPVTEISGRWPCLSVKPDLVHIHAIWDPFLHRAATWSRGRRIPVIWSPHGMLAPWAMKHKQWKKWLPWSLYQKRDLQGASLFHVTSDMEHEWIAQLGFTQRCVVVPLGTQIRECVRRRSEWKGKKSILFVGRIYPVKNLDSLFKAFARLRGAYPNWRLLLVGPDQSGHQYELSQLASELGLSVENTRGLPIETEADVVFTGALFNEDKDNVYRMADVFALPSHTENFGGVVAEALSFGLPCVVSNKTPWDEVEARECGFWVNNDVAGLEDALRKVMALSDDDRYEMGRKGHRLVVEKYTWPVAAEKMKLAYEWCVNHPSALLS